MKYDFVKEISGYEDFIMCPDDMPNGVPFDELFEDEDFDVVQVYLLTTYDTPDGKDIVGFAGSFEWKNNKLKSLDGDTYDKTMCSFGYKKWDNPERGVQHGLSILVEDF